MSKHLDYIDLFSGIFIIAMVILHIAVRVGVYENLIEYLFFMFLPWFYIKSGYFHKEVEVPVLLNGCIKKLLRPYFIYSLVAFVIVFALNPYYYTLIINLKVLLVSGTLMANIPLWFLFSLFIVKLMAQIVLKYRPMCMYGGGIFVLCVLLVLICFIMNDIGIKKPEWIAFNLIGLSFYLSGYLYKNKIIFDRLDKKILFFLCLFVIVIFNYILLPSFVHIKSNRLECGNYFLWWTSSCASCFLFLFLGQMLRLRNFIIESIGRYAMLILCTHWIILEVLDKTFIYQHESTDKFWEYLSAVILIELVICFSNYKLRAKRCING